MSRKALPTRLRKRWDAIIATDGVSLGLSDCKPFLENKLVNDIFYEGLYKGKPCIVKCSSRAPDSIVNEYELARRLYSIDPLHFPETYVCHPGKFAFVAVEKIEGGKSLADVSAEDYADEVLAILDALYKANVVYRDIFPPNFLIAPDGHLKLIDCQFAVDMATKRMDSWMKRHPCYHYGVFAAILDKDMAWWDDAVFASMMLPSCKNRIQPLHGRLRLKIKFTLNERLRLKIYEWDMRFRRLFTSRASRKRRVLDRRLARFENKNKYAMN